MPIAVRNGSHVLEILALVPFVIGEHDIGSATLARLVLLCTTAKVLDLLAENSGG